MQSGSDVHDCFLSRPLTSRDPHFYPLLAGALHIYLLSRVSATRVLTWGRNIYRTIIEKKKGYRLILRSYVRPIETLHSTPNICLGSIRLFTSFRHLFNDSRSARRRWVPFFSVTKGERKEFPPFGIRSNTPSGFI